MSFPSFPSAIADNYTISKFLVNAIAKPYILYDYIKSKKEQYFDIDNLYHNGNPYVTYEKEHNYAINTASFFNASMSYTPNALELNDLKKRTIDYIAWVNDRKGFVDFENYETTFLINDSFEISKLIFYYSKININGTDTNVKDKKIPAVIFAVKHLEDFIDVLDYFGISKGYGEYYNLFYELYLEKFKLLKTSLQIINFYKNAPNKYILAFVENKEISKETIWLHFRVLLGAWIPEKKELAILSIMEILSKNSDNSKANANIFLSRLLNWTILLENSKGQKLDTNKTLFSKLYTSMNDKFFGENNFTNYINTLYDIWLRSDFADSEYNVYETARLYKGAPSVIGYYNKNVLGFNQNNTKINFFKQKGIEVIKKELEFIGYDTHRKRKKYETITINNLFHLLQPIWIVGITEQGDIINSKISTGKLELKEIIPAFYLKAIDDQLKWANYEKATWLALDVVTTFSGVGNVLKFRHLTKVATIIKTAKTIASASKASINIYRSFKLAAGIVEITSGTVNAFLKLADLEDTKYGKALTNILIVLEMASLSGEITGAMQLALTKNAKAIVKNFDDFETGLEYLHKTGKISETEKITSLIQIAKLSDSEKLLRVHVDNYVKIRKSLKALNQNELLSLFKAEIKVKHLDNVIPFYEDFLKKYPKLAGYYDELGNFKQDNLAIFNTTLISNGKKVEVIEDLVHSGDKIVYDNFIKPFGRLEKANQDNITNAFVKRVADLEGGSRKNDSELKYIYHFLNSYIDHADEFVIETRNIYFTCTSCQRELLMLKKHVESLGKKITITVYGDEIVKGGNELSKK